MLIFEQFVSDETVEYFDFFLENIIQDPTLKVQAKIEINTCTINGYQTKNILNNTDSKYTSEILSLGDSYIKEYYQSNLEYYNFYIDHLHLIKYFSGGYQKGHTHCFYEDHSFILYLNDNLGITRLYVNGSHVDIIPQKNKIVFFNSAIFHEGLVCNTTKKVLVGSIKFLHKVWVQRK